jgi:hypothetical protein
MNALKSYLLNVMFAADVLLCAVFGGPALATCSAYAFRLELHGKPWGFMRPVIDWMFSPGHCEEAYELWLLRAQTPPQFR